MDNSVTACVSAGRLLGRHGGRRGRGARVAAAQGQGAGQAPGPRARPPAAPRAPRRSAVARSRRRGRGQQPPPGAARRPPRDRDRRAAPHRRRRRPRGRGRRRRLRSRRRARARDARGRRLRARARPPPRRAAARGPLRAVGRRRAGPRCSSSTARLCVELAELYADDAQAVAALQRALVLDPLAEPRPPRAHARVRGRPAAASRRWPSTSCCASSSTPSWRPSPIPRPAACTASCWPPAPARRHARQPARSR